METWRRVWREGMAPVLSTKGLQALRQGMARAADGGHAGDPAGRGRGGVRAVLASDRWGIRERGRVHAVPSLPGVAGEPAAGAVVVVLLPAGGAGAVPVHEQVRPPGRGQLLRP